jgi:hypothetical protein
MATGVPDNGFFSDQAYTVAAKIKTDYKQLFFYLAEANEQAHKYLAKLEVNQDLKELVAAALLARVLTAYQSLIILVERGFASEAKAVCRNILEAKFKLGFLAEEHKAAEMMLAKYEAERIKRLEKYKAGKLPVHKDAVNPDWQKLIDAAKARQENLIGPKGEKLPHISKIAEESGFSSDYSGPYGFFSDATHSGVGELDAYLEFNDENSAATNFRYGPSSGPWIPWCTLIATGYLIDCIEITATILKLRQERWFESWLKARNKRHQEILDLYRGRKGHKRGGGGTAR